MAIFLSDGPHLTSAKRMSDRCVFGVEVMPEKLEPVTNFVISQFSDEKTAIIVNDMSNSSKQHNNFGNAQLPSLQWAASWDLTLLTKSEAQLCRNWCQGQRNADYLLPNAL
jgi:hypothetical protein